MLFPGVELSPKALEAIGEKMKDLEAQGIRLDHKGKLFLGMPTVDEKEGFGISWLEIPPKGWSVVNIESVMVH